MKPLFKEKVTKFVSLLSMITLLALGGLFALALPQFMISTAGRVFAAVWAVVAIFIFTAHARRVAVKKPLHRPLPAPGMMLAGKRSGKTPRGVHLGRMMRG